MGEEEIDIQEHSNFDDLVVTPSLENYVIITQFLKFLAQLTIKLKVCMNIAQKPM